MRLHLVSICTLHWLGITRRLRHSGLAEMEKSQLSDIMFRYDPKCSFSLLLSQKLKFVDGKSWWGGVWVEGVKSFFSSQVGVLHGGSQED